MTFFIRLKAAYNAIFLNVADAWYEHIHYDLSRVGMMIETPFIYLVDQCNRNFIPQFNIHEITYPCRD